MKEATPRQLGQWHQWGHQQGFSHMVILHVEHPEGGLVCPYYCCDQDDVDYYSQQGVWKDRKVQGVYDLNRSLRTQQREERGE